ITKFKQCIEAYKGLFNNSMLGLFILSGNYIKYANPQAGKISAYTLEELLALNHRQMLSIIDPEDRNKVIKAFQKLGRKEETSGELEFRIFNKESGIRWIHAYISLIRYMDKPSFQIAFIDITDQKNLTQKLVESEKRYHDMYRHTPAIMHSINHEYRLVEVSDFWLETMGYKREEVIGRPSVDFLTPKSREFAIKKALPNFRKKGYARNVPYQFVKKNGEIVDVLFSAIAEYDNEGNMHRTLAIANDITQQKKNEQQIIESEVKYRNLVENSPVGIIVFINDKIELVNNAFLKLSGYHSMEEVMHISYADLIHPDDRQKVMQELKRKKSSEQALSHYYRMIRKNGEVIDVTEHTSEFNFHNKIYKQCIFEDITQVINTEESKRIIQDKTAFLERKLQINKQAEAELLSIIQSENLEINKFLTLLNLLRNETEIEKHWKIFEDNFASLHPDFFNKLHSIAPKLTQQDLKHCAFIKMKLDTKQIATLFNVKPSSVQMSRVRLKKKLRLKRSEDLFYFINSL
ncbi:MAG: PAS domain S-box protein, partial [Bacteroidota bacterium]